MSSSSPIKADASVKKGLVTLAATGGMLLIISWIFTYWDFDRSISAHFYSPEKGWIFKEAEPWKWLYRFGTIPGVALTIVALIGAIAAIIRNPDSQWLRYFLLVVLTSIIGAGLIVNGILKPYWGRPRPNQTQELGGQYTYRHVLNPGIPGKGKSFPSGHSTMGFIFVSLIYFRRKSTAVAWVGGIGGIAYGSIISVARVVQGAHFVTDCIWSLGVIWMVATALYYYVLRIPAAEGKTPRHLTRRQKQLVSVIGAVLSILLVLVFLTRRPYFESYYFYLGHLKPEIRELRIGLENGYDKTAIRYTDRHPLLVLIHARGFAWTRASETQHLVSKRSTASVYETVYRMEPHGYFSELAHEIEVVIPIHRKDKLKVVFMDQLGEGLK